MARHKSLESALDLDLPAEFDHAVRRNAEELRRRYRVAMHHVEDREPEAAPPRRLLEDDGDAADQNIARPEKPCEQRSGNISLAEAAE